MSYSYTGIRADGVETVLPPPVSAKYESADDAPADSFCGVFPLRKTCGTLVWLRISDGNGETAFYGTVDIQRETVSGEGNLLRVTCRSLAGLMLDSEAVPQTYTSPSLPTVFARHIGPYGFTSFLGSTAVFGEPLRIVKGMSEWQAAALFCKKNLLVTPRVHGTVFDASGGAPGGNLLLDNRLGTHYYAAEVRNRCCDRLTRIYVPDGQTGAYGIAAEDDGTVAMGLRRNRCLLNADADAEALLKARDRSAFAVFAGCPGPPEAVVGTSAALNDPLLGSFGGLTVAGITCTADTAGIRTRYCLRKD